MATKKDTTTNATSGMRRCIGSTTFGIEAHEAPVEEFPVQASAKDGLGRMCRTHWRHYTNALRKAAVSRKAAEAGTGPVTEPEPIAETDAITEAEPEATAPRMARRPKAQAEAEEVAAA